MNEKEFTLFIIKECEKWQYAITLLNKEYTDYADGQADAITQITTEILEKARELNLLTK